MTENQVGETGGIEIGRGLAANSTLTCLCLTSECAVKEVFVNIVVLFPLSLAMVGDDLGDEGGRQILQALALNSTLEELELRSKLFPFTSSC